MNTDFWQDGALRLAGDLAGQGQELIATWSTMEIAKIAGGWFSEQIENVKDALIATMRANLIASDANKFLTDFKNAGVLIEGELLLRDFLTSASDWRNELAQQAMIGRKQGIRFFFRSPDEKTTEIVLRLVEAIDPHGFTVEHPKIRLSLIRRWL